MQSSPEAAIIAASDVSTKSKGSMDLLGHVCIYRGAGDFCQIELYSGNLADQHDLPVADALVVSAYPNEYSETPTSLIGDLARKAQISVAYLARHKASDFRTEYDWWLSEALTTGSTERIRAKRILCFEPPDLASVESGHRFMAALITSANIAKLHTFTLPIILSGDQGADLEKTLTLLLNEIQAAFEEGVYLDAVRIVALPEFGARASEVFKRWKNSYLPMQFNRSDVKSWDVFLSYFTEDGKLVDKIEAGLDGLGIEIFRDRSVFRPGRLDPSRSVRRSRGSRVVILAIFSAAYGSRPWCVVYKFSSVVVKIVTLHDNAQ